MNIKSYINESLQQQSAVKSDSNKKETETNLIKKPEPEQKPINAKPSIEDGNVLGTTYSNSLLLSENKLDVMIVDVTTTTVTSNLNFETIESASSMVAINSNKSICSNRAAAVGAASSNEECGCNKIKKQPRRISLNENHNKYYYNNGNSNTDVQIFTNTRELNQVNLNSSSATTTTSTTTTTSSLLLPLPPTSVEAAARSTNTLTTSPATEIVRQQQRQQQLRPKQQLIMSPTMFGAASTSSSPSSTAMSAKLRKSHSTPALKFVGSSNNVDSTERYCGHSTRHENRVNSDINRSNNGVDSAMDASHFGINDVAIAHYKRQQQQQHQQPPLQSLLKIQTAKPIIAATTTTTTTTSSSSSSETPTTPESLRFGCAHYKRRAMFVTPCCNKFYKCRFCHDENESHHFDRKTLTELICSECNTRQKVQEQCEKCGVRFGKYTCLICNLFDDADKQQYHCNGCGICRIGGADNFFHCEVCNMCLPIQLKIDGHRCVENISRSHCPVCLGDIHTSRIPCHIPDCGHLLHKMCFDQLLASGHYTCPTCQTSLIDMTALWEYLDDQALRMPVHVKYENQRVHIFCNDCHKTSKTKFHFIGLKCVHCGAYNTTQDVKRRMSLVADEPSSA